MKEPFESYPLDEQQAEAVKHVRADFAHLLNMLAVVPSGHYRSLAVTALEEACMWAIKGISHHEEEAK